MTKYNFETRELVPYREDWSRDVNMKICGALWYIKEKDGLYLKIDEDKIVGNAHLTHDYCVAKGLPAAMLAQGDMIAQSDFNSKDFFYAYFEEIESLFPQKATPEVLPVMEDWADTLQNMDIINDQTRGYLDAYNRMKVSVIFRTLFNPYSIIQDLNERIKTKNNYVCVFPKQKEPYWLSANMPNVSTRLAAPVILSDNAIYPQPKPTLQVQGFGAAIINLAFFYAGAKRWQDYNFANVAVIKRIIDSYKNPNHIPLLSKLEDLSFMLPHKVEELFKAYMEAFEPIMREVWEYSPRVQLACKESDNVHTYIFACEISAYEALLKSELYDNLDIRQRQDLISYTRRFLEWLPKNYSISKLAERRIIEAIEKEMPPIQVTIKNNVKVTHAGEEEKPKKKQAKPKAKTTTKVPKATKETTCPYINGEELAKKGIYTVDDFQKKLRHACEQEAKVLVDFLIEHEKYGNLDFHGANMKAIYTTLRSKCFPTMRDYSYQNFAAAWKEALKPVA